MPVTITWVEPDTILLVTYVRTLLVDELKDAQEQIIHYLDTAPCRLHIMRDWSASTSQHDVMSHVPMIARNRTQGAV